jgi:hypothetical protein
MMDPYIQHSSPFRGKPLIPKPWLVEMQVNALSDQTYKSSIVGALKICTVYSTDPERLKLEAVKLIDDRCVLIYQNACRFAGQCINIPWVDLEDVIVMLV